MGEGAVVLGVCALLGKIVVDLVQQRRGRNGGKNGGNSRYPCEAHQVTLQDHAERLKDHEDRIRGLEKQS